MKKLSKKETSLDCIPARLHSYSDELYHKSSLEKYKFVDDMEFYDFYYANSRDSDEENVIDDPYPLQ